MLDLRPFAIATSNPEPDRWNPQIPLRSVIFHDWFWSGDDANMNAGVPPFLPLTSAFQFGLAVCLVPALFS